jgi:hypothetical protein
MTSKFQEFALANGGVAFIAVNHIVGLKQSGQRTFIYTVDGGDDCWEVEGGLKYVMGRINKALANAEP